MLACTYTPHFILLNGTPADPIVPIIAAPKPLNP